MTDQIELQRQIALTLIPGLGPRKARKILEHFGTSEAFFHAEKKALIQVFGLGQQFVRQIDRKTALRQAKTHVSDVLQQGLQTYFLQDETYPKYLRECADAPILLFGKGALPINNYKAISIVGTRSATAYGLELCEELISNFTGKNILVVSGLAYGIDIHVHRLCLKYDVPTIGVMGNGPDRVYPAIHRKVAKDMLKQGGILTEFLPGTKPEKENFPMRNRIVAGISQATIVIESKTKGGSLITATLANDYNRDVFAFPGQVHQPYSEGCNWLIQQNKAHLIRNAQDFFRFMDWPMENASDMQLDLFKGLAPDERSIIKCFLNSLEQNFEGLVRHSGLKLPELSSALLRLEIRGLIRALPGQKYLLRC
ncbi:MAG: DNA-protecting protein DprA [Bacteroidetes bacterium]|nr:MAG: DNA-protecting protein DprA [Bacteroidota bacterium]